MNIVGLIIWLNVRLVDASLQVQLHVQEVDNLEVSLNGDGKVVPLEYCTDGFLQVLSVSGA